MDQLSLLREEARPMLLDTADLRRQYPEAAPTTGSAPTTRTAPTTGSAQTTETAPTTGTAPTTEMPPTTGTLRQLMRRVAQPVVVVTGRDHDGRPRGMTISSFTSVSLDPPLALFCASRTSRTWAALGASGRFVVNVLTAEQHTVAEVFARPGAGFPTHVPHSTSGDGLPVLTGSAATAHCSVAVVHPGGDHDIVVARIGAVCVHSSDPPLTYWRGAYTSAHDLEELSCLP